MSKINMNSDKVCIIIAGPNGAGKTTFAKEYLPKEGQCIDFVNADLIAAGLSPFDPDQSSLQAGKLMLQRLDQLSKRGKSFSFETTLSGLAYLDRIREWKALGYTIILYFLNLRSVEMAIDRVRLRVKHGGHNIPEKTIRRRFQRGRENLERYKELSDSWMVFDNSDSLPILLEKKEES